MPKATALHPIVRRQARPPRAIAALRQQRSAWLASLASEAPFLVMFDHLPGVCFFVKDRAGRTMFASRAILERYHMKKEDEMLGLTDFDINPGPMATAYVRDDKRLLDGAAKQVERIELWWDRLGLPEWYLVTKLPIHGRQGRVEGVMGILRKATAQEEQLPIFQTVSKAVAIIRKDYAKPLTIAGLAEVCGESLRQLQRHFQSAFGISAQEFLIRTRVIAAAKLLEETTLNATEIAARTGFGDSSSFAEQFRQRCGTTPTDYRASVRQV